jgi:hypothetical protein
MSSLRERILAELAKPVEEQVHTESFDPWGEVIQGIYGSYASQSDVLMIRVLEAVRDRKTFDLINNEGFAAEFMLYVLAGRQMLEYGTSPRGGWPDPEIEDLWQPLINKWREYFRAHWGEEYVSESFTPPAPVTTVSTD